MVTKSFLVGTEDEFNKNLAQKLGIELIKTKTRIFSDGEVCPKTFALESKFKNQHVIYCSRKAPDANPNDYFINFLFEAARLKKAGATVTAVMPYMVYASQNKEFIEKGETAIQPISIETVVAALAPYVREIVTVTPHFQRTEGVSREYSLPIHIIDGFNVYDKAFKGMKKCKVIAPDEGMASVAEELSLIYNCDFDYAIKHRDKKETDKTETEEKIFDVENRIVIVPDDMIRSGGTMMHLIEQLRQQKAKQVYVAVVHGAFAQDAYENLKKVCDRILFTDTLKNDNATHSIVDLLADYIERNKLVYKS